MGNDIVELSTEKESFINKIGPYDEKWLEDFKPYPLKQIDDERRAISIRSRMEKQMKKNLYGLY